MSGRTLRKPRLATRRTKALYLVVAWLCVSLVWYTPSSAIDRPVPSEGSLQFSPVAHKATPSRSGNSHHALPEWLEDYLQWHQERLKQIEDSAISWQEQPMLMLRCMGGDRCGGTADRLKSLPFFLALAAKTRRLVFIRWTRPCRLERFMIPGPRMNWTVPQSLLKTLRSKSLTRSKSVSGTDLSGLIRLAHEAELILVDGPIQLFGSGKFRRLVGDLQNHTGPELTPREIFPGLFRAIFQPAPPVQLLLKRYMKELNLRSNEFSVAHYRAKFPGEPYRELHDLSRLNPVVYHAVNCASSLHLMGQPLPELPSPQSMNRSIASVYVASDSIAALKAVQEHFLPSNTSDSDMSQPRVVSQLDFHRILTPLGATTRKANSTLSVLPNTRLKDPPHLNFAEDSGVESFFPVFVDLFLMSHSRCVSYGPGGFGQLGSMISHDSSCRARHSMQGELFDCTHGVPETADHDVD